MNSVTSLKHKIGKSILASLIIVSVLACFLSSCIITTETPTSSLTNGNYELTSKVENAANQELTLVSDIEVVTEIQTVTFTPGTPPTLAPTATATFTLEPSATPTPVIDFEIPDAPSNADPFVWREQYIDGMLTNGYLRLKVKGGLVRIYWDSKLGTIIWDLGSEKFGYNNEFKFTGEIVKDTYGKDWIVRKKLTQRYNTGNSIWDFYRLHKTGSDEIVMGVQCNEENYFYSTCGVVGQFVGVVTIDMVQFLVEDFDIMTEAEKGRLYANADNFNVEFLLIRVPKNNGYTEIKFPICPSDYCDTKIVSKKTLSPKGSYQISGLDLMNSMKVGGMVYANFGLLLNLSSENIASIIESINGEEDMNKLAVHYFFDAFGQGGELLHNLLVKEFGIGVSYKNVNFYGTKVIFDADKLVEEKIIMPASVYLY